MDSPSPSRRRTLPWVRPVRAADVGDGFVLAEAAAHQDPLAALAGRTAPVHLDVTFVDAPDAVVAVSRNRNVGFVPAPHAEAIRAQLSLLRPRERLGHEAEAFVRDGVWHVWIGRGPRPADVEIPVDAIQPKPRRIAGVPLER